jgi:hypothetical protein
MTELSWLVDLLLNHKLSKPVRDHVANRIRDIEAAQPKPAPQVVRSNLPPAVAMQAPSTIANMTNEVPLKAVSHIPTLQVSAENRIIGGEVSTGAGIRGPRKF